MLHTHLADPSRPAAGVVSSCFHSTAQTHKYKSQVQVVEKEILLLQYSFLKRNKVLQFAFPMYKL